MLTWTPCWCMRHPSIYRLFNHADGSIFDFSNWGGLFRVMWQVSIIGIDTKIEVIVVSPTTWEAHRSPRAKPKGGGELPMSLVTPQWPKARYQFLFYHDASKHIKSVQIRVCIRRKSLRKLLQIWPIWKAWPQTIVTAASLVTSWLPLWCHSDACVTKSWQSA